MRSTSWRYSTPTTMTCHAAVRAPAVDKGPCVTTWCHHENHDDPGIETRHDDSALVGRRRGERGGSPPGRTRGGALAREAQVARCAAGFCRAAEGHLRGEETA